MNESAQPFSGRLVVGLVMLALGVLWTADNLGLADASAVLRWWPALFVAFGVSRIAGWGCVRNRTIGILFTVLGTLMIGGEFGWVHAGLGLLWPLALVALGVQILARGSRAGGAFGDNNLVDGSEYLHSFALMGGSSTRSTSTALRGGELSAIMGGVELDLREARPADGRVVMDVFAFMGGIEIVVPPEWSVEFNASPVMGGLEDSRGLSANGEAGGTLVVRGVVILGGLEVSDARKSDRDDDSGSRRHRRSGVNVRAGGVRVRGEGPDGIREVRADSAAPDAGTAPPTGPR
jgi:hypothetical protein